MIRYRIAVGRDHGVLPKNIVGAIANEAGLDNRNIGHIKLYDAYSTVDLPEGMPREVFKHLQGVWVCGRQLRIQVEAGSGPGGAGNDKPPRAKPRAARGERPPPRARRPVGDSR